MLYGIALAVLAAVAGPSDTTFVLGSKSIDLTGDGAAELMVLLAHGPSIDSLGVTFQILSSNRIVYATGMGPLMRRRSEPEIPGTRTEARQAELLADFGAEFFADGKFSPASLYVEELGRMAPGSVAEIPGVIARHREAYRADPLGGLDVGPVSTDTTGAGARWSDMRSRNGIVFRFSPGGDRTTAILWDVQDRRFYQLLLCC
jgi:hypothetical protein